MTFINNSINDLGESYLVPIQDEELKIKSIAAITGLRDIESAFNELTQDSDVELLVCFLDRKYDLSRGDDNPDVFHQCCWAISNILTTCQCSR